MVKVLGQPSGICIGTEQQPRLLVHNDAAVLGTNQQFAARVLMVPYGPFARLCKGCYLRLADLGAQGSMWVSIC